MLTEAELYEQAEAVAAQRRDSTGATPLAKRELTVPKVVGAWILVQLLSLTLPPVWILASFSQLAVASMWLAVGRTAGWRRMVTAGLVYAAMIGLHLTFLAIISLAVVAVLMAARLAGLDYYLRAPDESPADCGRSQFRIWHLLLLTAVAAVLAAVLKDSDLLILGWVQIGAEAWHLALWWLAASLLVAWAAFRQRLRWAITDASIVLAVYAGFYNDIAVAFFAGLTGLSYCGILLLHLAPLLADEFRLERR